MAASGGGIVVPAPVRSRVTVPTMMGPRGKIMTRTAVYSCLPVLAVLAFVEAPAAARAADAGDAIVVTALRTPVDDDKVSSSVTVLDAAAIAAAQPVAVTDILTRTPGISLARNGGYGEVTSLRIRGAAPGQTVLVIDGMRMADATATDGGFDFSQLLADDISRIEVLRGPQAILWGSDAIGGVVNVTTTAPTRPLQADFSVQGGSHQSFDAQAALGGTSKLLDWRVSGSAFTTEGIPTLVGGTVPNGYSRQGANATTTFHLADNVSLDVRGYWDSGRNSFSDTFTLPHGSIYAGNYALTKQWSAYAGLNVTLLGGRFHNRLAVLQNQTDSENVDPYDAIYGSALTFVGHGRIRRYEYQGTLNAAKGVDLVFGAEREEAQMATGSPYDAVMPYDLALHHADTNSLYGELRLTPIAGLTLNGGVRYDHQSQFGGNTVFSAGAAYTPDQGVTVLRASYDEGFKAPSLYQQFSDYGSAALKPEKAHGWEVGFTRSLLGKTVQLGATWWERRTTNLIDFAYCPSSGTLPPVCFVPGTEISRFGYYANIDRAQGRGLELTASARLGHAFAEGNYSIVVNEDRTDGSYTFGQQLPRVPRHLANATLGYDLTPKLTTSVALRWSGASLDSTYSGVVLPAYAVVDWRAEWQVAPALRLFGRVENLGDKQYRTAAGYNSLGRTVWAGLTGHF